MGASCNNRSVMFTQIYGPQQPGIVMHPTMRTISILFLEPD